MFMEQYMEFMNVLHMFVIFQTFYTCFLYSFAEIDTEQKN